MTTRTYETMVLLDNQEVKRDWNALKSQVCGLFEKHGSSIRSAKVWEERRLAYPIDRQLRATYFLVYHDGVTDAQGAISRDLEYSESVLRHLTVVCDEIPEEALDGEDTFDPEQVRVESTETPVAEAESGEDEESEDGESKDEDADGESKEDDGEESKSDDAADESNESKADDEEETKA